MLLKNKNNIYSIYYGYLKSQDMGIRNMLNGNYDIHISKFASGVFGHLLGDISLTKMDDYLDDIVSFLKKYLNNDRL